MQERSREELLDFLNTAIARWKHELAVSKNKKDPDSKFPAMESTDELKAKCYLDAYKSMKVYLVTSTLECQSNNETEATNR